MFSQAFRCVQHARFCRSPRNETSLPRPQSSCHTAADLTGNDNEQRLREKQFLLEQEDLTVTPKDLIDMKKHVEVRAGESHWPKATRIGQTYY